jgi:Sap, sulfolipid-1-addressing protein
VSSALAAVVLLGIGCAANPWGIMMAILLLPARRGHGIVWVYVVAWIGSISAVLAIILVGLGAFLESGSDTARTRTSLVELGLGLLLLGFGFKRILEDRRAPARPAAPAGAPPLPGWLKAIESISYVFAFLLGVYSATYPLVVAAGGEILSADVTTSETVALAVLFVVLGSSSVVAVAAFGTFAPTRSAPLLDRMRAWLTVHNRAVINAILIVAGLALSARAITTLL